MHSISIKYDVETDENELWHALWMLLSSLRHNGQLCGRDMNPHKLNGIMSVAIVTATEDALDEQYHNSYVAKHITDLESLCKDKLAITYLGIGENQENEICLCKKSKHYLMRYFSEYSPIQCGSCFKAVPLFKINKLRDDGYEPLTSWMSNMMACILLDINCTVGEKWAIKQQSDPHTELGKLGISVAKLVTEKTGVNCYYYLHNYAKRLAAKDNARPCPSCGGAWALNKEIHQYVWFKCDACLLMSGKTTNS
jgi:predicted  nucleic acid-binding Zn ribbon protein